MAANHSKLIALGVGAILAAAAPMSGQAKQPSADTLKAEARNFFKIISGDKRKSQTYCKIVELNDQIATSRRALAQTSSRMQKNLSAASGGLIAKLTAAIAARTFAYLSFKR